MREVRGSEGVRRFIGSKSEGLEKAVFLVVRSFGAVVSPRAGFGLVSTRGPRAMLVLASASACQRRRSK